MLQYKIIPFHLPSYVYDGIDIDVNMEYERMLKKKKEEKHDSLGMLIVRLEGGRGQSGVMYIAVVLVDDDGGVMSGVVGFTVKGIGVAGVMGSTDIGWDDDDDEVVGGTTMEADNLITIC